jgi:hypothetical protein
VSIDQKEPYQGMVKCQTIILVYGLVDRWSIKCFEKVATLAAFRWKNDEEEQYQTTRHLVCLFFTMRSKRAVSFQWNIVILAFRVLIQGLNQSSFCSSDF